jgi:hypothetical protein
MDTVLVASGHDVANRSGILNAQGPRHSSSESQQPDNVAMTVLYGSFVEGATTPVSAAGIVRTKLDFFWIDFWTMGENEVSKLIRGWRARTGPAFATVTARQAMTTIRMSLKNCSFTLWKS